MCKGFTMKQVSTDTSNHSKLLAVTLYNSSIVLYGILKSSCDYSFNGKKKPLQNAGAYREWVYTAFTIQRTILPAYSLSNSNNRLKIY